VVGLQAGNDVVVSGTDAGYVHLPCAGMLRGGWEKITTGWEKITNGWERIEGKFLNSWVENGLYSVSTG